MDDFRGSFSRATAIRASPELKKTIGSGGRFHGATRFDSENVDINAPIIRYLSAAGGASPIAGKIAQRGSRSPLSSVANLIARSPPPQSPSPSPKRTPSSPAAYRTPVKAVEGEEVLVMDGVSLRRSSRFSGSDSSGSSGKSQFKPENFHFSEFVHTKEDLRPNRLNNKNKTELQVISSYINNPSLFFLPETILSPFSESNSLTPTTPQSISFSPTPTMTTPTQPLRPPQPMTPKQITLPVPPMTQTQRALPAATAMTPTRPASRITKETRNDWAPQDDGIKITLPSSTNGKPLERESSNAYINLVLFGPKTRRLPVFSEFCPDY